MNFLKNLAIGLMVIGAINWGLIAFFQFDLVAGLFGGQDAFLSRIVYGLVGLSGLYYIISLFTGEQTAVNSDGKVNYGTEFADEDDLTRYNKENSERRLRGRDE